MTSAIIFDVDGTLVDSVELHARAWQEAFRHFGIEVPFEKVRSQIGKGADQILPEFLSSDQRAEFGKRLEEYRTDLYQREYLPQVRPFPGVKDLFARILADGKRIALASSAPKEELEHNKKLTEIDQFVQAETSADDAEKSKPHPDIFQAALDRLAYVHAEETIVVGDSPYDAEAARKLGIATIGLLSGGFEESWLRSAGCIAIYRDPADLLEHYWESPIYLGLGMGLPASS